MGLLRRTEEQGSAWRKSRDRALLEEDTDEAGACERELMAWEQTTLLLRRVLRVLVERAMGRETSSGPSHPGSGRPAAHMAPRPRRPSGRPPRNRRYVDQLHDLLRAYQAEDLSLLDEKLTEATGVAVEVLDGDDGIEILVDGKTGELEYPFSLADLDDLVAELRSAAAVEEPRG